MMLPFCECFNNEPYYERKIFSFIISGKKNGVLVFGSHLGFDVAGATGIPNIITQVTQQLLKAETMESTTYEGNSLESPQIHE